MLDTYYFKDKKQVVKMLNESKAELTNWFFDEMQKYENAQKNFDQWFEEYTGQSFDEMLKDFDEMLEEYTGQSNADG